jgi:hypothetical protein
MQTLERLAIVLTHADADGRLVDMPWLDDDLGIGQSDWVVLSADGWRLVADGDPAVWPALERRLRIGFHVSQPDEVLVVGHARGSARPDPADVRDDVGRIAGRVRSLRLPSTVRGVWTDGRGRHRPVPGPEAVDWDPDTELACAPAA